ncbi:Bug family tripartite tricarboxylate transporter substrate binding protein [Microbaculum sp. FT89]|uniref:Bug family tripartite tricarboxylate transporter substrate binding protein n=1 Tax=Microbaculum sp. FT89 TaxID=3447298 RepID=UPI003F5392E1
MFKVFKALTAAIALTAVAGAASAQDYPNRSISVIVPYSPGGTDTLARTIAQGLSNELGQTVVVENKPGAGGTVGGSFVANAEPDGYTFLFAVSSVQTVAPHQRDLPYGFDALRGVARVSVGPNVMAARKDAPFTTMEEMVVYAKENPGEVSYGSAGTGGATHIASEAVARAADVELFHIPFQGVTPAVAAAVAGEVDLVLGFASAILPQAEAGKVTVLAQLGEGRAKLLPDVPTLKESGIDLELPVNIGFWAPAGTPDEVVNAFAAAVEKVITSDELQEYGKKTLSELQFAGPADFDAMLAKEDAFYEELLSTIDFSK